VASSLSEVLVPLVFVARERRGIFAFSFCSSGGRRRRRRRRWGRDIPT
jgi:hypothetical protein